MFAKDSLSPFQLEAALKGDQVRMDTPVTKTLSTHVGEHIKKIRRERGLTQEALAGPEFTKGYISALERGAVRPSLKALEIFARRLEIPIADFLSAWQQLHDAPNIEALQEDILYQCNYAKMLLRTGQTEEAMQLIAGIDSQVQPYVDKLPSGVKYLVPFLRGRAYLEQSPKLARPELEAALEIAAGDEEATARVRNLLGVVLFALELPYFALEQHLQCLEAVQSRAVKDPNFKLSVYRNLANDYWALNDPARVIGIYREALPLLKDLDDMEEQARVFWGMAMAYRMSDDWPQAKLYATRALHIYEAADNRSEAASICLNIAELFFDEERYEEAGELLKRAEHYLEGTGNKAVMSYLYRDYADLERRQGRYEEALGYARKSVSLAEASYKSAQDADDPGASSTFRQAPARTLAEALGIEALIEERRANTEVADRIFSRALALLEPAGFEETRDALNFSYAEVLKARGDFEKAVEYYRAAAQHRPHKANKGI